MRLYDTPLTMKRYNREQRFVLTYNHLVTLNNKKVLDVGCGNGELVRVLRHYFVDAHGIDRADCDLECDKFSFYVGNVAGEFTHITSKMFDVVICNGVLEHLRNPVNLVKESMRVLVDGGCLIIRTPNFGMCKNTFYDDYNHLRPCTPESLRRILSDFGFKVELLEPAYIPFNKWLCKLPFKWHIAKLLQTTSIMAIGRKV